MTCLIAFFIYYYTLITSSSQSVIHSACHVLRVSAQGKDACDFATLTFHLSFHLLLFIFRFETPQLSVKAILLNGGTSVNEFAIFLTCQISLSLFTSSWYRRTSWTISRMQYTKFRRVNIFLHVACYERSGFISWENL